MRHLVIVTGWGMKTECLKAMESCFKGYKIHSVEWGKRQGTLNYSKEIISVLEHLPLEHTVVLGWSLGAMAVVEASFVYSPAALILIGATGRFTIDNEKGYRCGWPMIVLDKMIEKVKSGDTKVIEAFCENMFTAEEVAKGFLFKSKTYFMSNGSQEDRENLAEGLEYLKQSDIRRQVRAITTPALLIHGSEDKIVPIEAAEQLAMLMDNPLGLAVISGAGHGPFITRPYQCRQHIQQFLIRRGLYDL